MGIRFIDKAIREKVVGLKPLGYLKFMCDCMFSPQSELRNNLFFVTFWHSIKEMKPTKFC